MPQILDQMSQPQGAFRPTTTVEYFALQLARKLNDMKRLRSYLTLLEHHSQQRVLTAFERASGEDRATRFSLELAALTSQEAI